jgi:hypothetical protein
VPKYHPIPAACPSHKHPYLNLARAKQAARNAQHVAGHPLRVYKCRTCRQYHLTSQDKPKTTWVWD